MLLLFVHLRSQQKRTKGHLQLSIYSVAILTSLFESSNHK